MTTARSQHTATLLQDGRVLITGGAQQVAGRTGSLASAEVYDPATGGFASAANMTTARRMHTATLLPDGTVLIAGGYGGEGAGGIGGPLASAELYDPSSNGFTKTGNLLAATAWHTALLLATGRVLIVGGSGDGRFPDNIAPAQLYDPDLGTFTAAGAYVASSECDFCAPAVRLTDGTVLFLHQYPAQIYDPDTNAFRVTGRMIEDHIAATLLLNGKVLLAGGESDFGRSAGAELYNAATGTFSSTGAMTTRRSWHSLTLLPSGQVLAAGGETDSCSTNMCSFAGTVRSAELYDPATGVFHAIGDMIVAHEGHTATLLADGRVLIAGGDSYGGISLYNGNQSTAEIYRPDVLLPAPTLLGAIYHAGTSYAVGPDDPAAAGDAVDVLCKGFGPDSPVMPQVAIGGRLARIVSMGDAPGVAGVKTLRVQVPQGVAAGSVLVRLTYLDRSSNTVTMWVK
jgi:hypothetical protein